MAACLSFRDILEVNRPQIHEMERLDHSFSAPGSPEACEAFSKQIRLVEAMVIQTYGVAATLAKRADNLNEVADVWGRMSDFCQSALQILANLKDKYPDCGTPEVYDAVLDFKLAADKRYKGVMEEKECEKMNFPTGLFPAAS